MLQRVADVDCVERWIVLLASQALANLCGFAVLRIFRNLLPQSLHISDALSL